jgi:hypothetical protein
MDETPAWVSRELSKQLVFREPQQFRGAAVAEQDARIGCVNDDADVQFLE